MLLRAENLFKRFEGAVALDGVSFEVKRGEILAIIGPNGAGKSVLFGLVSGLLRPTSGRISFEADEITGLRPHKIARKGIARTFQLTALFNQLRVIDNLLIGFHQRAAGGFWSSILHTPTWKSDKKEAEAKVAQIVQFLGLEKRTFEQVSTLSQGEQRLLSIGIALMSSPKMILLDEPTEDSSRRTRM